MTSRRRTSRKIRPNVVRTSPRGLDSLRQAVIESANRVLALSAQWERTGQFNRAAMEAAQIEVGRLEGDAYSIAHDAAAEVGEAAEARHRDLYAEEVLATASHAHNAAADARFVVASILAGKHTNARSAIAHLRQSLNRLRPKSRALKSNRRTSRRIRANARARTFQEAKRDVIALLKSRGWSVRDGLKVPHATSPDGAVRLWFKTQAVHHSHGNASLGDARSVGYDIRFMPPEEFVTKVESFARRAY
jgi:hypothetical protein